MNSSLKNRSRKSTVTAELTAAIERFNRGRFEEAGEICSRVLADDPDNVEALNILGGSLARTGRIAEAILAAQRVCFLSPGNALFYSNLSYLHGLAGNFPEAALTMAHAVNSDPENAVWQDKFARLMDGMEFYRLTPETDVIRNAIGTCLGNTAVDAVSFTTAWHSLLLLDPAFVEFAASVEAGEIDQQVEQTAIDRLAGPLSDPFLLRGMRSLHAVDERLERILTSLRRLFLVRAGEYDSPVFLPFLCALAEHCMLNEYVYWCTEEERALVDILERELDSTEGIDPIARVRIALLHCYTDSMPYDRARIAEEARAAIADDPFVRLAAAVVSNHRIARQSGMDIPELQPATGYKENAVSSAVAEQYEENPYPRWRRLDIPPLTDSQKARGKGKTILVAGCGTGYELLNLAVHYPEAQVLGVDLSLASLAYGMHKAEEFGIGNVEFMRADILELEHLDRDFDLITSVGVLHHMEDPVEGWRKLLMCLKPDGFMKIGLYSEDARRSVAACRQWVRERGFEPTPQGIRRFRQAVMALDAANPLREIMTWTDFWSMSMCRDLVFHVQEHNVTLPWIKSTLEELGLCCLSMRIGNPMFRKEYRSMCPGDTAMNDLDGLHRYEKHNPAVFRDMYQFWCCRKESPTAARPPAWFYTTRL